MRSAPIGLLTNRWDDIPERARECGAITHTSPRCLDGSVLIACASRYAANTRDYPFIAEHFIATLTTWCGTWQTDMPLHLTTLLQKHKNKTNGMAVADWVISIGLADGESDWRGTIGCGVLQSSLWSIYCFMCHPDNFVACVGLAIQPGGDVDTTAAMAGALSGARVGIDGIPRAWVDAVNDRGCWRPAQLQALVEDACACGVPATG
jgi:ADP-ribosylglycohydrolase